MNLKQRNAIKKISNAACDGIAARGLNAEERVAAEQMQRESSAWLNDMAVQAIGIGGKVTSEEDTGVPSLKVYVERKLPTSRLRNPAPKTIRLADGEEYPVDVVEIGRLQLQNSNTDRVVRPLHPGISIANVNRDPGTLGLFVQARGDASRQYILSNYHVLAPFSNTPSTAIRQPAEQDGGGSAADIAHYERAVPLHFSANGNPNIADAAIARLNTGIAFRSQLPYIGEIKGVTGVVRLNKLVRFIGRTTGMGGAGRITDIDVRVQLPYPTNDGGTKRAGFYNQIFCTPYSAPGDSGSAIVNSGDYLIGLHVAGSGRVSMFSRIVPIFNALDIELISGDAELHAQGSGFELDIDALLELHSIFDSVSWRLTRNGVEVAGEVKGSAGKLVKVPEVVMNAFGNEIRAAAEEFDVPIELIIACICTESGGNANAEREEPGFLSDHGTPHRVSVGLMQTLISTAREALDDMNITRSALKQPNTSIRAGTAYIKQQFSITDFDPPKVASAYNAGGVYINRNAKNRWKMKQYPIGTGKHADRFIMWFNDCFRYFEQKPEQSSLVSFRAHLL